MLRKSPNRPTILRVAHQSPLFNAVCFVSFTLGLTSFRFKLAEIASRAKWLDGLMIQKMIRNGVQSPMHLRTAHLIRVAEAARLTGLPQSLLRKSFMAEEKRPKNVPSPPPHKRIGRAVYILADRLAEWIETLGQLPSDVTLSTGRRRGRPTVTDRMASRREARLGRA